ncbi:hypothetical protein BJD20_16245 [Acinetobacter proteolyticus]|uniref:hypothetical protein n=1 Tax=Acinetobacter TaxID=469 RepID=UPI00086339AF|nr:hypothetical protein [Acinetobacter proteolyticus]OEY95281.1 hypothetical protein BJD20_16245 [Acinetobacter proteolyticus]
MFTLLVEVMMSVFIANFKANEHPVIIEMVSVFLISVVMFLLIVFLDISSGKESSIGLALAISVLCGVIISIGILMVEFF